MSAIERLRSAIGIETRVPRSLELRDPSGATTELTEYHSLNKTMIAEWNAEEAIRLAYYSNVFVFRAVSQCAMAIAGLPFRAGKDPEKPDTFNAKSPLAILLSPPPGGPAPGVSARRLWAWTIAQYLVTGRWAWEVECEQKKGKGKVVHLWPLVSACLHPIPTKGGDAYFSGYRYGKASVINEDDLINFNTDQVLYGWRPALHDYRQPESPLQAARLAVSVAVMQDRYDYAFLRNDARPAAIIVHEQFALSQEKEAFKRAWRADFRGPDNAGKAIFIEAMNEAGTGVAGALDIKTLGLSQRDAQFVARYEQKISEICVALGTPLSILGDSTKRTYDAANVEHRNWWENTLQPLAQEVADQINLELAPRLGDEIGWFDFSKVTALQSDSRLLALGANIPLLVGPDKPIASSELRHELGLPDVRPPDTDEEIAQAKEAKAQAAAIASAGPTDPNAPGKGAPGPKPAPGVKNAPDITPTGPGIGAGREGNLETRGRRAREIRQIEYRKIDSTVRNLEPIFEGVMKSVFEKQQRSVMAKFNARGGRLSRRDSNAEKAAEDAHASDTKKLFDGDYWDAEIAALLSPHYTNVAAAAAEHLSGKIGVSFDVHNPQVAAFIRSRANLLAGNVNQTTYDAIANAMAEGQEAGDSIPMIAGRIQDVFEDASNTRATMIARTEVIGSFNGSTHEIGQLLPDGMVAGEEWLATEDDRTREAHIEADGQQIAMGDVFSVDGEDMRYPGDPNGSPENVINCRCALVLLTPDEFNAPDDDDERSYNLEDLREQLLTEA